MNQNDNKPKKLIQWIADDELFKSVRFHSTLGSCFFVLTLLSFFGFYKFFDSFPFVLAIFLAGTLGGVTNNYIRLKAIPADQVIFPNTTTNKLAIIQVYVSPIIAGVFGCILYGVFVSGILRGALFPEFTGVEENFQSVFEIFNTIDPKSNQDSVKAIVWSFVAGFSEKMVPNIIDKIADDIKEHDKKNGINGNSKNNVNTSNSVDRKLLKS
ncbi:hypothetical protein QUF90_25430 [Desulfococcaceae bacterium HSG9]|nr:hypothetical protein [Desulfococcaceae bacterium HSG9]